MAKARDRQGAKQKPTPPAWHPPAPPLGVPPGRKVSNVQGHEHKLELGPTDISHLVPETKGRLVHVSCQGRKHTDQSPAPGMEGEYLEIIWRELPGEGGAS